MYPSISWMKYLTNATEHIRTIKMKPADVQLGTIIDHGIEHNDKDPKFKVDDHVRI